MVICFSPAASLAASEEEIAKISSALPNEAQVQSKRARTLLVFNLCNGFVHKKAIDLGTAALELMGEKTGAYKTVISEDISMFEWKNIRKFDAICFNNTTGELFTPKNFKDLSPEEQAAAKKREERLKKNLLRFVSSGKGIVGIHAGTDCFYQWPEFGEMMGGYFQGHPWNENVFLKNEDPDNPVSAAFAGNDFEIADEIYQFKDPYSRKNLRVLLSLDTTKTDMTKGGIRRVDNDFAVSWVRSYGKGRVFYCSLGHRGEIFWNPVILQHYLDGIQFAMGDIDAQTTPSAQPAEDGWRQLFNAKDFTGWMLKPGTWVVKDGAMERIGGGYVWTAERFGDFVLDLEFKISKGGNSGIFFRTDNISDCVQTGIEMQVLDSYGKETVGKHDCGAIYDALAPSSNPSKAPGEWNHAILTANGSKIKVVLNDVEIIDMDLDDWTEAHKNPDGSKNKYRTPYKDMPRDGHIGFQEHGNDVAYRSIRIKPILPEAPKVRFNLFFWRSF